MENILLQNSQHVKYAMPAARIQKERLKSPFDEITPALWLSKRNAAAASNCDRNSPFQAAGELANAVARLCFPSVRVMDRA
jgi:hypothetical protein